MIARQLTAFEIRTAKAALGAMFPGGPLPGIHDLDVESFFADTLSRIPLEPALGIRFALVICALAPLVILRRFATLAALGDDDRARVVSRLVQSPYYAVRQLTVALKALGALLYAAAPAVRGAMTAAPASLVSLESVRQQHKKSSTHAQPSAARAS